MTSDTSTIIVALLNLLNAAFSSVSGRSYTSYGLSKLAVYIYSYAGVPGVWVWVSCHSVEWGLVGATGRIQRSR